MNFPVSVPEVAALIAAGVFGFGAYALSRTAVKFLRQRGAPPHTVRSVRTTVSLIGVLLAAAVLVAAFGPVTAVSGLTVSAIGGLAVTLALQTTIANIIAGYILLRNSVLRLGDQIVISGVKGQVVQLGLVTTWLRMDDGSLASVSNSTLLSGPMMNKSAGDRLKGEY
jgi:small-conductance mechanosensitive channel